MPSTSPTCLGHQPLPLPIHVLLDELDVLLGEVAEAALKLEVLPHRHLPLGPDVDGPLLPVLHLVEREDLALDRDPADAPAGVKPVIRLKAPLTGETVIEDQVIDKAEEHLFDGRWYIEKREATKSVIKREIVRPGEKFDPFRVGQGPFPLPFGQKEQDILRNFEVTLVRADPKTSPDTVHLKLVPKGGQMAQRYREIHFYISRKLDLPVKVVALQKDDKKMTVVFKDIRINRGIAGSRFVVTIPDDPTWSYTVEPLPKQNIKQ